MFGETGMDLWRFFQRRDNIISIFSTQIKYLLYLSGKYLHEDFSSLVIMPDTGCRGFDPRSGQDEI